eukprot:2346657-Pleurochrysis_carterae.AAC.1
MHTSMNHCHACVRSDPRFLGELRAVPQQSRPASSPQVAREVALKRARTRSESATAPTDDAMDPHPRLVSSALVGKRALLARVTKARSH